MAGKDISLSAILIILLRMVESLFVIYVLRKQRQSTLKKPPKIRRALKKSFQRITD